MKCTRESSWARPARAARPAEVSSSVSAPPKIIMCSMNWQRTKAPGSSAGLFKASTGTLCGLSDGGGGSGYGAAYTFTAAGDYAVLHSFGQNHGEQPNSALIEAGGLLYGVTAVGGAFGEGEVFSLAPDGTLAIIHSFAGVAGGGQPSGELLLASDSNFYGVTTAGGDGGNGTIYQLTQAAGFSVITRFEAAPAPRLPLAGLIDGQDGFFYGTSSAGGANDAGTIFKVTTAGTLSVLDEASLAGVQGFDQPLLPLAPLSSGAFLSTAASGGDGGFGALYEVARTGEFSVLHPFDDTFAATPSGPSPAMPWEIFMAQPQMAVAPTRAQFSNSALQGSLRSCMNSMAAATEAIQRAD